MSKTQYSDEYKQHILQEVAAGVSIDRRLQRGIPGHFHVRHAGHHPKFLLPSVQTRRVRT